MILKSTFHQNDISCKRISPLKTSDILCEELLMDSVYVYVAMCFKSAFAQKRGTVHRESTLSGSVRGQPHSALHDLANSKPTANLPSRRLVATRCIRGQQDRSDSWLCPFPSTRKSYLSQSTTPAPALQNSVRNKSYFAQWVKGQNEVRGKCQVCHAIGATTTTIVSTWLSTLSSREQ